MLVEYLRVFLTKSAASLLLSVIVIDYHNVADDETNLIIKKSIKVLVYFNDSFQVFINEEWVSRETNFVDLHFPVFFRANVKQFFPPRTHLFETVMEEGAIIFQEENTFYRALLEPEVNRLVRLVVVYVLQATLNGRLSPVPECNAAIHIVAEHMLWCQWAFGHSVQERASPRVSTNSTGLPREQEELSIWKILNIKDRGCDEIHINWCPHADIVLYDEVGHRHHERGDGMAAHCERSRLMPLCLCYITFKEMLLFFTML